MNKKTTITIDDKSYQAELGKNLVDAAAELGVFIPTLCYLKEKDECLGTCRVCSIKVNDRVMAACTLKVEENQKLEVNSEELKDIRKGLIELLFVEGNHFCPSCEKSGDCTLQALAYEMEMNAPRFHYRFNNRQIDFEGKKLLFEHNRCVLCKLCTHHFQDQEGQRVFSFKGKGSLLEVEMNIERADKLTNQKVEEVINLCPVGAILKKGKGFDRPIGSRTYDNQSIAKVSLAKEKK